MRFLLFFSFIVIIISCNNNLDIQVGNKTLMNIDSLFNAGEVIKGEMITAKFKIQNIGDYPLVIGEVKGSCSCTVAEYPEKPINPGDSGYVLAYVNTEKTGAGIINKSVRIVANTNPSINKVIIKANIINR